MSVSAPVREAVLRNISGGSYDFVYESENEVLPDFFYYVTELGRPSADLKSKEVWSTSKIATHIVILDKASTWEAAMNLASSGSLVERRGYNFVGFARDLGPTEIQARELLTKVYEHVAGDQTAPALRLLFGTVEKALAKRELVLVESVLAALDPKPAGATIAVGLLRATFRVRAQLKSWNSCVVRVWKQLDAEKRDTTRLLRGLVGANGVRAFTSEKAIF